MIPSSRLFALLLLSLSSQLAWSKWNATGTVRNLWATPVMEYSGLFSDEQLQAFADDVKSSWSAFLKERSDPRTRRVAKPQAFGASTPSDKDRINEEFFNYQGRNPINQNTLEVVWQAFCFAVDKFLEETGIPPIEYQSESRTIPGTLEWTKDKGPQRGKQYCWSSLQFGVSEMSDLFCEIPLKGSTLPFRVPITTYIPIPGQH